MNRIISLFLFIFIASCLNGQYNSPIRNKVTLGKQTTADGLVFRGVANIDTVTATSKITRANKQDTSVFILLDTVTNLLWHYKTASNGWIQAGGGNAVTSVAALTLGTSGTDLSSSVATSTTTPVITLNVPTASATNRGALSSADWTTFNNKQSALTNPVLASGTWTSGYLPKINGTYTIGNSLVYDNATSVFINATTAPALGFPKFFVKMATANSYEGILVASSSNNNVIAIAHTGTLGLITTNYGTGGTNTNLGFGTNGATQMTLDVSGNVGIGTTSPSNKLNIVGQHAQSISLESYSDTYTDYQGEPTFTINKSASNTIGTKTNTRNNENLGSVVFQGVVNSAFRTAAYLRVTQTGVVGAENIPAKFGFYTSDGTNSAAERMTILANGNVGIGTASPISILDVVGNIPAGGGGGGLRFVPTVANDGTTQYGITIAGAGTGASQFIAIGVRNGAAATKSSAMWVEATQPGLNIGYAYSDVAPNNGAIINGNVGIGTTSPTATLDVRGIINQTGSGNVDNKFESTTNSGRIIQGLANDQGSGFQQGIFGSSNSQTLFGRTAASIAFMYTAAYSGTYPSVFVIGTFSNQDLILGTNNTQRILVSSSGAVTINNLAGINDVGADANGKLQAATSDINLKNTIEDSPFGLNEILLLNPVTFLYNDENRKIDSDVKEVGFIAQDVFDIIPNAVSSTGTGDLQLDYRAITAALVKAIQEQNALIKALEQRLLILENK